MLSDGEVTLVVISIPEPHVYAREFLAKITGVDTDSWWSPHLPYAQTFNSLTEAEAVIHKLPRSYSSVAEVTKVIFTPRFEHYT